MLILIGIVPVYFALDSKVASLQDKKESLIRIEKIMSRVDSSDLSITHRKKFAEVKAMNTHLQQHFSYYTSVKDIAKEDRFTVRKDILLIDKGINSLIKVDDVALTKTNINDLKTELKSLRKLTDYSPGWVILLISFSLGMGTMIGWKRIVKTIGEKIGKEHLTYAQGASAELVAATTIGLSSNWGWPVSTTQVLSSAVAGSMVASKGVKNLQPATVRNILLTWALTLPIVVVLSGSLFLLFRNLF